MELSKLEPADALFVAMKQDGMSTTTAYLEAYSGYDENKELVEALDSSNKNERDAATLVLRRKAYAKLRERKIKVLQEKYVERVKSLGEVAIDTLEDLMISGKSEKVRGDVAMEVLRHNIGSPDKQNSNDGNQVIVIIGEKPQDTRDTVEILQNKREMEKSVDYNEVIGQAHERRARAYKSFIEGETVDG